MRFIELLQAKLGEMRLHEDTGDPSDVGYMNAVRELDRWTSDLAAREAEKALREAEESEKAAADA